MPTKIKRVRFGLPKPNVKSDKILFYASLNGSITPEIGDDPTFIDPNLKMVEGAYGLQAKGALIYPLKGLDLAQPFTISFTYNVTEDAYVGSWTNIFSVSLKNKEQAGQNKVFQLLTTVDSEKFVNFPTINLFNETLGDLDLDKPLLSVPNRYRRFTLVNSPEGFSVYLDNYLICTFKGMTLKSEFANKPELQININTGHNGNGYQRYGISEVFVAQEVIPPMSYKGLNDDSIILPRLGYLGVIGNCEYNGTVTGSLPSNYRNGSTLVNGYVRDESSTVILQGQPWLKLFTKTQTDNWSTNDIIKIKGSYGEIIRDTPKVQYMYNGQLVNVVGSWSGIGTKEATFTFGDNANLTNQDIQVTYNFTLPKREKPLLSNMIANVISMSNGDCTFHPTKGNVRNGASVQVCLSTGDSNEIFFQRETNTLTMDKVDTRPLDCLFEFDEIPTTQSSSYKYLTPIKAIASTMSLSRMSSKYQKLHKLISPEVLVQLNNEPLTLNGVTDTTLSLNPFTIGKFDYNGSFLTNDNYGLVSPTAINKLAISRYALVQNLDTGEVFISIDTKLPTNTQYASVVADTIDTKYIKTNIFVK